MANGNLHNCSHHADIHHDPPKGNTDPMLAEVHGQAIGKKTGNHAEEGEPDAVQTVLGPPVGMVALVDPVVEDETDEPAWKECVSTKKRVEERD